MNPLINLQTGWTPPLNQISPGLMGNVLQPPQAGLMGGQSGALPSLQNVQPGDWSGVAYNMAGRPIQGPSPAVTPPPMPAGVTNGTQSSGGSAIGGTALGILGALAKNPSLLKSAGSGVSSLWNSLTGAGAAGGSVLAGGTPALSAVGTGAVAPAVDSAAADASAALGGADAAGSGAAGGLLGAGAVGSGAVGAAGANALAASGGFATGGGATAASTASGAGLGAAGTAAAIAAPFVFQQAALALGDAWTKKNTQGNAAMKGWMQSTGATYKPNYTNSGQNTFGTNNGLMNASSNPGTMYDKSGKAMTPAQAANAIYAWAVANHVNPGDFHPG